MARRRKIAPIFPRDPLENNHEALPAVVGTKKAKKLRFSTHFLICLATLTTACTVIFFAVAFQHFREMNAARTEYNTLRAVASQRDIEAETHVAAQFPQHINVFDAMMREINPHFVCWIRIEGTRIDYPVVRAQDNEQYLQRTFAGAENEHGAVFMDYRNMGDFVPHIIIYGHNTRYGNMFSDLHRFLNQDFLAENPYITLITDGRVVNYSIFSARRTDIHDPAFFLDFSEQGAFHHFLYRIGAPADATQIITLSTCVSGNNADERVIVQGALIIPYDKGAKENEE